MTREKLLKKLKTKDGKREIAEKIALVWWDRMDLGDAEEWYIESTISGYPGLMSCSKEEWIEHAIDAEVVEEAI